MRSASTDGEPSVCQTQVYLSDALAGQSVRLREEGCCGLGPRLGLGLGPRPRISVSALGSRLRTSALGLGLRSRYSVTRSRISARPATRSRHVRGARCVAWSWARPETRI